MCKMIDLFGEIYFFSLAYAYKMKMFQNKGERIKKSINKNLILHPIFLIFAFFACIFWNVFYFLSFLLSLMCHEYAHYLVAKNKGVALSDFKLMPYGAQLCLKDSKLNYKDDILIAIAGPLANIFLGIIGICSWWIFPESYPYTEVFVYANFSLAFFNFLPLLPLDGSRICLALAGRFGKRIKAYKILKSINIIVSILLFALFIISLFSLPNISLGVMSFFILFTAFEDEDKYVYESLALISHSELEKNKPLPLKFYCIDAESDIASLFKLLNPSYYVGVIVFKDNKIKKVIMQKDFEKLLNKGDMNGESI